MKIGVRIDNAWSTAQQLRYAKTAETLGFDSVWAEGNPYKREPFSMLGVLARETSRVELALAVASVHYMHPLLMASMTATVDELSGGRMRLGIGCSSPHALAPLGMQQTRPLGMVREAVEAVRALLRGGPADYSGRNFNLNGVELIGASGRAVPILVAAEGPKMQDMTTEVADGLIFMAANEVYNRRVVEKIEAGLARAGRERARFQMVAYIRVWTTDGGTDEESLLRRLAARLLYRVSPGAHAQMGLDPDSIARFLADPATIPMDLIREMIILGDAEQSAAGVRALAALGFEELVLDYPALSGMSHDEQFERYFALMRTFGEDVLPKLDDIRATASVVG